MWLGRKTLAKVWVVGGWGRKQSGKAEGRGFIGSREGVGKSEGWELVENPLTFAHPWFGWLDGHQILTVSLLVTAPASKDLQV